MSVMCVSLSVATVYAVGQVTLDIAADSRVGPTLRMKFGFGAQIVIGLPVVGNVSILYMVGVEIYTDSTQLNVSAFLLISGTRRVDRRPRLDHDHDRSERHRQTAERRGAPRRWPTDLEVQVTFAIDISIFLVIDIDFSEVLERTTPIA